MKRGLRIGAAPLVFLTALTAAISSIPTSAHGAPAITVTPVQAPAGSPLLSPSAPATPQSRGPRASVHLDVGQKNPWVGQAVPVTVTAVFRDVTGVTLEGAVQIASNAILTSQIAPEPRQSTEIRSGQRALVVTWHGTFTPSSPGPLDLSVELPVRFRYQEAAPHAAAEDALQDDPFAGLGADPFGSSLFRQMQQRMDRMMNEWSGHEREQSMTLTASVKQLEAVALPTAGQPAGFEGAVGRFDLTASVSSGNVAISDPVTLRVVVTGTGDLDRVALRGVSTSDSWKAYPVKVIADAQPDAGRTTRKVFEQTLIPLHGGELTVPPVSIASFDPATRKYVIRATAPLAVAVEGSAKGTEQPVAIPAPVAAASPPASPEETHGFAVPSLPKLGVPRFPALPRLGARNIGLGAGAMTLALLALALRRLRERGRAQRAIRRRMRRAAEKGNVAPFFDSAHRLIETRLAHGWGIRVDEVTPEAIRARLGEAGAPLIELIAADEALRFGRADMEPRDLRALCHSIERSLHGALS